MVDGKRVLSVDEVVEKYGDYLVIVGTDHYGEEVFIDAGSFNGYTSLDFLKWANGNCKKIYALKPLCYMYNDILNMYIPKTEVLNYAAWNKKEKLHFMEGSTASCVSGDGKVEVYGMDIDSIVNDKVTFIKMDIEGSELKALEG